MTSPTARSLAYLRKRGYVPEVVERFNYFSKKRVDYLGVIDILAIHSKKMGVLGIQATSRANMLARVRKCQKKHRVKIWLAAGNKLEVHGWGLMGRPGKRKKYEIKIVEIK